jgi:hypothetical protein
MAASTPATMPMMSVSRLRRQESSSMLCASALTLATKMSRLPSAVAVSATQARNALMSAISATPPQLFTPFAGERHYRFVHRRLVARAERHVAALIRQQLGDPGRWARAASVGRRGARWERCALTRVKATSSGAAGRGNA